MLKEERQEEILNILNVEQKVIASDLSLRFSVSEDTIRRDLKELDQKGLIRRVHSGALRVGPPVTDFTHRTNVYNDEKILLGQKALTLLKEDTVIIIDGGTTILNFVKQIPLDFRATIITNSPTTACALEHHHNIHVTVLGGTLDKESMVNLGIETLEMLDNMRADLYVMGIYNIDSQEGLSVPTLIESQIKRKMASISKEVMGIVTSDKVETVSNNICIPTDELTYLVTNNISPRIYEEYKKRDVLIID